jgi:predicted O-methyltransferase YrrM
MLFARHRRGHGIHSPFVFHLVSEIFRNKSGAAFVYNIENQRKKCLRSSEIINVVDLGAGSDKLKTSSRKVSGIARYSSLPQKYGILLSALASEFGKPAILELGTSLGISAMYLAAGAGDSVVYTVEGSPATLSLAGENFSISGLKNIFPVAGSFDDALNSDLVRSLKFGLVFIDGDHRKEPLLKYFNKITGIVDPDGVIVIDDIHLSPDMEEAWELIKSNESISVTIDLYRFGMVFFRRGMSRTDYVIRY